MVNCLEPVQEKYGKVNWLAWSDLNFISWAAKLQTNRVNLNFTFLVIMRHFLQGFYATYDEVFKTIAEEDRPFIEEEEDFHIYEFGNSTSSYEEVRCFWIS